VQGQIQDFGLGGALAGGLRDGETPRSRRMLRHQAKKPTYRERKTRPYIVWQYHNYHHLIHSSFYVSSNFCLKIQNTVCGLQSQRNGPQWQPGLIKLVSWKEHYRSTRWCSIIFVKKLLGLWGHMPLCPSRIRPWSTVYTPAARVRYTNVAWSSQALILLTTSHGNKCIII